MPWPAFNFHSALLIFVTLWPISTLCVADMVLAVADIVCGRYGCGRYRRFLLLIANECSNCDENKYTRQYNLSVDFNKNDNSKRQNVESKMLLH